MIPAFVLKALMLKFVFNFRPYPPIVQVTVISLANSLVTSKQIKKIQDYSYLVKSLMSQDVLLKEIIG